MPQDKQNYFEASMALVDNIEHCFMWVLPWAQKMHRKKTQNKINTLAFYLLKLSVVYGSRTHSMAKTWKPGTGNKQKTF